jgi:predicted AlkP superfamily pyrophosphatase or phosphodiesterase
MGELAWSDPHLAGDLHATGRGLAATHGYDPRIVQMHGIFYAWGSGVAPHEIKRLDMVDIHPTVMSLLDLQPGRPVDGKPLVLTP